MNAVKIEALTAGEYGGGQLLGLGGGQNEHGVARRLLQGFEQRVERSGGEHVHLVDDVDLVAGQRGRILDLIPQIADFIHAVVGRRVDFQHVHAALRLKGAAHLAFAAGITVHGMQAVDGAGEHLGRRGFSGAAGAAKQIGVGDAAGFHLSLQGAHNRVLIADFRKRIGPPCAVQRLITHDLPPQWF